MAEGTYSAYQQLTPIREDFGNNIARQERTAFRYRQEQRQEQALEQQQQDREIQQAQQAAADIASITPVITGVRTVDEINYRATGAAKNRIGEIHRQFKENPASQADVGLRMELANLKNFPTVLKGLEGKVTAYAADLAKGFAEGKYSKWDQQKLNELEAFFGVKNADGTTSPNYVIDFDKQGNMVAKALTKDGKYFEKSITDIMNGYEYSSATPSINAGTYTDEIAKNLGKRQTSTVQGGFIVDEQNFNNIESELRATLGATLGDPNEPSDLAKSVWADEENMNMDPAAWNQNSLKQVEDYLVNQVSQKYDQTQKRRQLTRSGGSGGGAGTGNPGDNITLMKDESGNPIRTIKGGIPSDVYAFSIGTPVTQGVGNKEKKINTLYLNSEGNIMFSGEERIMDKGPKNNFSMEATPAFRDVTGGFNKEELNNLAVQLGFQDTSELKNFLAQNSPEFDQGSKAEALRQKYEY